MLGEEEGLAVSQRLRMLIEDMREEGSSIPASPPSMMSLPRARRTMKPPGAWRRSPASAG